MKTAEFFSNGFESALFDPRFAVATVNRNGRKADEVDAPEIAEAIAYAKAHGLCVASPRGYGSTLIVDEAAVAARVERSCPKSRNDLVIMNHAELDGLVYATFGAKPKGWAKATKLDKATQIATALGLPMGETPNPTPKPKVLKVLLCTGKAGTFKKFLYTNGEKSKAIPVKHGMSFWACQRAMEQNSHVFCIQDPVQRKGYTVSVWQAK